MILGEVLTPADFDGLLTGDIDECHLRKTISDAMNLAVIFAPCALNPDFPYMPQLKALVRQAIMRWYNSGQGVVQQETIGDVGIRYHAYSSQPNLNQSGPFTSQDVRNLRGLCTQPSKRVQTLAMFSPRDGETWETDPWPYGQN